ncbi:MAG: hypothetical protein Ct9H90mP4_01620 [Gammaproteobacteria bacterium]|nr:MAG: hypothetical protein Ct9H90mP4_01620 [Gammaproteobacteria bacterium]
MQNLYQFLISIQSHPFSANQVRTVLPASGTGVNSNPNLVAYLPVIIEALEGAQVAFAA